MPWLAVNNSRSCCFFLPTFYSFFLRPRPGGGGGGFPECEPRATTTQAARGNYNALEVCIANKTRKVERDGVKANSAPCTKLAVRRSARAPHCGRFVLHTGDGQAHYADTLAGFFGDDSGALRSFGGLRGVTLQPRLPALFRSSVAPWAIALAQRFLADPSAFYADALAKALDAAVLRRRLDRVAAAAPAASASPSPL